jgi:hypothetical protein
MEPIQVKTVSRDVLPEIAAIIEEMVRLYNDNEDTFNPILLKVVVDKGDVGFGTRYQTYNSKEELLSAIVSNCPTGMDIIQDI